MWSPYASNYDNPIRYNDFFGDEGDDPNKRGFFQRVKAGFVGYFKNIGHAVTHPVETAKSLASPLLKCPCNIRYPLAGTIL